MSATQERILVIRLGALGDLTLCFQAFAAIRQAHPKAQIALLTMPAFVSFARDMPWFDDVLIDQRPALRDIKKWAELARAVRVFHPTRVYDLQGKFRQTVLYALLGGPLGPEWSGAALLCSHPRLWPPRSGMHFTDFIAAQLERAGIDPRVTPDLSWLEAPLRKFSLPERYALLIPGCAPTRPYKRWPAAHFAALAKKLREDGITCLAVGTKADADSIAELRALEDVVIDLSGRTTLKEVAALARKSEGVVGNDTGPTHLAAVVGAKTLCLMSDQVNPAWSAPKGERALCLQGRPLAALDVEEVFGALRQL